MARTMLANERMMVSPNFESTAIATAASTGALLALGKHDLGAAWAPIDAMSHVVWGDEAIVRDELDIKHTLIGAAIMVGGMAFYGGLFNALFEREPTVSNALIAGGTVAALAYVVDLKLMPHRLTPGFQYQLTRRSIFGLYAMKALAFAAGGLLSRPR